jgi:transposase
MQLKTILNHVQRHKSFVYDSDRLAPEGEETVVEIAIKARANSRPICSGCGKKRPGYDTLPERRFEFVPLWGLAVFFLYAPRRVRCASCGVKVERVPWAEGKSHLTTTYQWFLARRSGCRGNRQRRRFGRVGRTSIARYAWR